MENITYKTVQGLLFCVYSPEEIKKSSVLEITNLNIFDALGHPTAGSLHDPCLGPNDRDEFCATCGLNYFKCPGHAGHISLPLPVYNPIFLPRLYQLLRGSCFYCNRLLAPPVPLYLALYQLQALDHGLVSLVQDLEEAVSDTYYSDDLSPEESLIAVQQKLKSKFHKAVKEFSFNDSTNQDMVRSVVDCRRNIIRKFIKEHMMGAKGKCPHCKMARIKIALRHNSRIICVGGKQFDLNAAGKKEVIDLESSIIEQNEISNEELTPLEAKKHLCLLWENDKVFLQHLYKTLDPTNTFQGNPVDMFFMDVLVVPPVKFRRLTVVKGRNYPNPQSAAFNEVLKDSVTIKNLLRVMMGKEVDAAEQDLVNKIPGKSHKEKLHNSWIQLQNHINEIFDSDSNKLDRNKTVSFGIKQLLEYKKN